MLDFATLERMGHEQVVFCSQPEVGLRAIIALHNTALGPGMGGVRMWAYESDGAALIDVLRLSKAMAYKAALAGLNFGGGKAVIIGDPKRDKSEGLFRAFGRFVDSLGGRYVATEDVGITPADLHYVLMETRHVVGVDPRRGGAGNPGPFTAHGVFEGLAACLESRLPGKQIGDLTVAVQGVGSVGGALVRRLCAAGARVVVSDIDAPRAEALAGELKGVRVVTPADIYDVTCDVFAPCALGAVVNRDTIGRLKCSIVAGAANNQLAADDLAEELERRGILYAPDYAINAGGLINVAVEYEGYDEQRAYAIINRIPQTLQAIFDMAKRECLTTAEAADRMAERRMHTIAAIQRPYQACPPAARYPARSAQSPVG